MKKKILFFSPTGHIGGAEKNLVNICRFLPKNKYEPIVVLPPGGKLHTIFKELSIRTIVFRSYFLKSGQIFNVLFGCFLLWNRIRKERIDIIHSNSIFSLYLPVYYGKIFKIPVIIHWADFDVRQGDKQLVNLFAKNLTIIAVSKSIQKKLESSGINKNIIKLIYNGVSAPIINDEFTKKDLRLKANAKENDFLVGLTGRIDTWKGHKYALAALAKLQNIPIKLIILGDFHIAKNENLETEIKTVIQKNNLETKVNFIGFVENPVDIVRFLDVILVPSEYEPFGLVAIEAMSLQKPVIASNVDGLAEIITNEENGILVPSKDPDAIAASIKKLYENPELCSKLSKAGYKRYVDTFTIDCFVSNLEKIYENQRK
jgi:L-malate glycosyltransferase